MRKHLFNINLNPSLIVSTSLLMVACSSNMTVEDVPTIAKPAQHPTKTISNFEDSLSCMDSLFLRNNKQQIPITSAITDQTLSLKAGVDEMLRSALSGMSEKSNAFSLIDNLNNQSIAMLKQKYGLTGNMPFYYVKGGITQLDKGILTTSKSIGGAITELSIDGGINKTHSSMSVDFAVYDFRTSQQVAGAHVHNSITFSRRSKSGPNIQAILAGIGLSYQMDLNTKEGSHQAVRNLIQYSMIELMGKFTHTSYHQCLGLKSNDAPVYKQASKSYHRKGQNKRITAIQTQLKAKKYYHGAINGKMTPTLSKAIKQYQSLHNLTPTGKASFEVYNHLNKTTPTHSKNEGYIMLSGKGDSNTPVYRRGEEMQFTISSATGAYAACYYQNGKGETTKIYPNQFTAYSKEKGFIRPKSSVTLPDSNRFQLRALDLGAEYVDCYSYHKPFINTLPREFRDKSLQQMILGRLKAVQLGITGVIPNINRQRIKITIQ